MPRRKSPEEPQAPLPPDVQRLVRRWLLQLIALVLIVGLMLTGLIWLGKYTRDLLREHERFQVAFADIECNPPPPLAREEFLDEVQYYAQPPKQLSSLDEGLTDLLKEKFGQHPWVAKVEAVAIERPKVIRVKLAYRQPVLAVVVAPSLAGCGFEGAGDPRAKLSVRGVDRLGVLLPKKLPLPSGLAILHGAPPPSAGEGKPWGDPGVALAADIAARLTAHGSQLGLTAMTCSDDGLILWTPKVKFLWGNPAAQDQSAVAAAIVKEKRLLLALKMVLVLDSLGNRSLWSPGDLWIHECDLRPADAVRWCIVARGSGFQS